MACARVYQRVNKLVIPDLLPTVEGLCAKFHGSMVLFKLALRQGYTQVPLHPDGLNLTPMEVFCYIRMPFGLSSAPYCLGSHGHHRC